MINKGVCIIRSMTFKSLIARNQSWYSTLSCVQQRNKATFLNTSISNLAPSHRTYKRTIFHQQGGLELLDIDISSLTFNANLHAIRDRLNDHLVQSFKDSCSVDPEINKQEYPERHVISGLRFHGEEGSTMRNNIGDPPAVIVLHEGYGLNASIKHFAQDMANLGFNVIAPDFLSGRVTTDFEEAKRTEEAFDYEMGLLQVQACVDMLESSGTTKYKPRVGIVGFGMGGSLAVAAARRLQKVEVFAGISLYGCPPLELISLTKIPVIPSDNILPVATAIYHGSKDRVCFGKYVDIQEYISAAKENGARLGAMICAVPNQTSGFMNFTIPNKKRKLLGLSIYEHEIACAIFHEIAETLYNELVRLEPSESDDGPRKVEI